ncbi:hypothetical protein ARMGADRAFT_1038500 [Armillaria gallica]|uniref:Uncharacterized protein n=1 Tax=Armillaria gallica TaxID=47427 RepID=A0A2H3D528_ARMGA|nr:hypothetical protein ARMGADRAFT_1038500 [Armillaria gallica]
MSSLLAGSRTPLDPVPPPSQKFPIVTSASVGERVGYTASTTQSPPQDHQNTGKPEMNNIRPSTCLIRNGAPLIPPQNVTGGQSHQAKSTMDTPGKQGEEPAVKTAAPPPPGGRDVSDGTPSLDELTCLQLSQTTPGHPIPSTNVHIAFTRGQSHTVTRFNYA